MTPQQKRKRAKSKLRHKAFQRERRLELMNKHHAYWELKAYERRVDSIVMNFAGEPAHGL